MTARQRCHAIAQWLEARRRVGTQARNQNGVDALEGEFMVLDTGRNPAIAVLIDALVFDLNREWRRGK
jgi:hypothetical protein